MILSFRHVQNQEDGFNCGAFAIAYATDILEGIYDYNHLFTI